MTLLPRSATMLFLGATPEEVVDLIAKSELPEGGKFEKQFPGARDAILEGFRRFGSPYPQSVYAWSRWILPKMKKDAVPALYETFDPNSEKNLYAVEYRQKQLTDLQDSLDNLADPEGEDAWRVQSWTDRIETLKGQVEKAKNQGEENRQKFLNDPVTALWYRALDGHGTTPADSFSLFEKIKVMADRYNIRINLNEFDTFNSVQSRYYAIQSEVEEKENARQYKEGIKSGRYQWDAKPIYQFKDGWAIWPVSTASDLELEGEMMNHCIGDPDNGHYWRIQQGGSSAVSLRDPDGVSHATAELTSDGKYIASLYGYRDHALNDNYQKRMKEYFDQSGVNPDSQYYRNEQWAGGMFDDADLGDYDDENEELETQYEDDNYYSDLGLDPPEWKGGSSDVYKYLVEMGEWPEKLENEGLDMQNVTRDWQDDEDQGYETDNGRWQRVYYTRKAVQAPVSRHGMQSLCDAVMQEVVHGVGGQKLGPGGPRNQRRIYEMAKGMSVVITMTAMLEYPSEISRDLWNAALNAAIQKYDPEGKSRDDVKYFMEVAEAHYEEIAENDDLDAFDHEEFSRPVDQDRFFADDEFRDDPDDDWHRYDEHNKWKNVFRDSPFPRDKDSGFQEGDVVSYEGRDTKIIRVNPPYGILIAMPDGGAKNVPRSELSAPGTKPDGEQGTMDMETPVLSPGDHVFWRDQAVEIIDAARNPDDPTSNNWVKVRFQDGDERLLPRVDTEGTKLFSRQDDVETNKDQWGRPEAGDKMTWTRRGNDPVEVVVEKPDPTLHWFSICLLPDHTTKSIPNAELAPSQVPLPLEDNPDDADDWRSYEDAAPNEQELYEQHQQGERFLAMPKIEEGEERLYQNAPVVVTQDWNDQSGHVEVKFLNATGDPNNPTVEENRAFTVMKDHLDEMPDPNWRQREPMFTEGTRVYIRDNGGHREQVEVMEDNGAYLTVASLTGARHRVIPAALLYGQDRPIDRERTRTPDSERLTAKDFENDNRAFLNGTKWKRDNGEVVTIVRPMPDTVDDENGDRYYYIETQRGVLTSALSTSLYEITDDERSADQADPEAHADGGEVPPEQYGQNPDQWGENHELVGEKYNIGAVPGTIMSVGEAGYVRLRPDAGGPDRYSRLSELTAYTGDRNDEAQQETPAAPAVQRGGQYELLGYPGRMVTLVREDGPMALVREGPGNQYQVPLADLKLAEEPLALTDVPEELPTNRDPNVMPPGNYDGERMGDYEWHVEHNPEGGRWVSVHGPRTSAAGQNWVYLNGQVARGAQPHHLLVHRLGEGYDGEPIIGKLTHTWMARNGLPQGLAHDVARGHYDAKGRPAIWESNCNRNMVWDAVKKANPTAGSPVGGMQPAARSYDKSYDEMYAQLQGMGWDVMSSGPKAGMFAITIKNNKTGGQVERTGKTLEQAAASALTWAWQHSHMSKTANDEPTGRYIITNSFGTLVSDKASSAGEAMDWAEEMANMGEPGDNYEVYDTVEKKPIAGFFTDEDERHKNFEEHTSSVKVSFVTPAQDELVFDSLGGMMSAREYQGEAINSYREHHPEKPRGSVLYKQEPDGSIWVDSIYSKDSEGAMELFGYMRQTYPGVKLEGMFMNERLKALADRYNQSNGHTPMTDQERLDKNGWTPEMMDYMRPAWDRSEQMRTQGAQGDGCRELHREALKQGWGEKRTNSGWMLLSPDGVTKATYHLTNSDWRAVKNFKAQLVRGGFQPKTGNTMGLPIPSSKPTLGQVFLATKATHDGTSFGLRAHAIGSSIDELRTFLDLQEEDNNHPGFKAFRDSAITAMASRGWRAEAALKLVLWNAITGQKGGPNVNSVDEGMQIAKQQMQNTTEDGRQIVYRAQVIDPMFPGSPKWDTDDEWKSFEKPDNGWKPGQEIPIQRAESVPVDEDWAFTSSEEPDPDFTFIYYQGALEVEPWAPNLRPNVMLKKILDLTGKEITDYNVDDNKIGAGDIYNRDGEIDVRLNSLCDEDVQTAALDSVHQWAQGMNLVGPIQPVQHAAL